MRQMKDSGIEWIGEIPQVWDVVPIRAIFCENLRINYDGHIQNALQFKFGKIVPKTNFDPTEEYVANAILKYSVVQKDMFVINGLNLNFDFVTKRVGIVENEGVITSAYMSFAITDIKRVSPRYSWYVFRNYDDCGAFHNMGGGVRKILTFNELKHNHFILPPLAEQERIAEFLDEKCAEVDALAGEIKEQIATLEEYKRSVITEAVTKGLDASVPMKDSGIEWIGEIPQSWDVRKGKYVLQYLQKPVRIGDEVITCFRDGQVTLRGNRREDGFTMADKEIGYQGIDEGDLVVHGMDGFAGAIGISDCRGKASPVLNVLDTQQNKRYVMFYLRSLAYRDVFLALSTGIRVRSCDLRWNKLAELFYLIPPLAEQKQIVAKIDEMLAKVDALIAEKQNQLATLEEYKKSVIFEYVTGQKEVV